MLIMMLVMAPIFIVSVSAVENYDAVNATKFVFSDSGIAVTEGSYTDYSIEGTALTIKGAGTYIVSGSCKDGSIKIKKGTTGVSVILNGLDLTSSDTAPLSFNKSSEATLIVAAGTYNTLADAAYNNDEVYTENTNAENAVIKCKDGSKVTICGSGALTVVSNGKNGIKSGATTDEDGEALLTIKDVTLNITASVNDAINAEATLNILSGSITISAADDGIHSDYYLNIGENNSSGPVILIKNSYEGIEAATLNIYSGNVTVHAEDDGINAANSDLTSYSFSVNIYGGNVYVDAAKGDGIDSNGTFNIYGGKVDVFSASSGDNSPIDADRTINITSGTVLAVGAPGMGATISGTAVVFGATGMGGMTGPVNMGGKQGGFGNFETQNVPSMGNISGNPFGSNLSGFGGMQQTGASNVSIKAGDMIAILDSNGNTVYSAKAVRAAGYVVFASEKLTSNATYTLSINGTASATAMASNQNNNMGGMGGQQGQFPGGNAGGQTSGTNMGSEQAQRPEMNLGGEQAQRPETNFGGEQAQRPETNLGDEQAQRPEMNFGGEQAQRPEMNFGGEQAQRPEMNFGGEQAQRPEMNFGGEQTQRPEMNFGGEQAQRPEEPTIPEAEEKPSEPTTSTDDKTENEEVKLPSGFIEWLKQLFDYLLKLFGKETK